MSKPSAALSRQAIFFMCLLTIQFGTQPMLTAKFTPKTVCRSTIIVVQESVKFCLAMFMLISSGNFKNATKDWSVASWIQVAAVPAGLYTVQNGAALLAYQHLDGITFNVLNQTKTLSAALCCYLLIGRKQSKIQIISLFLLLLSALIIENIVPINFFGSDDADARKETTISEMSSKHLTHGVIPVLFASFLSGLAGAISQKNLQNGGRNPYLFSAELCIASLTVLSISTLVSKDGERIRANGFFDQWTPQTLIPILTNSVGGIVVGLVTKYAGSVRKGFALIFGMLFTGFIQSTLESDVSIKKEQIVGGLIASLSLWMHATNPFVEKEKAVRQSILDARKKEE
jgi:UDP-sugar transporter A1/2/3